MFPLLLLGAGAILWLMEEDQKKVDSAAQSVPTSDPPPNAPNVPSGDPPPPPSE